MECNIQGFCLWYYNNIKQTISEPVGIVKFYVIKDDDDETVGKHKL